MSRAVSVASFVACAALFAVCALAGDPNYMNVLGYRANLRLKPFSMVPQPNYYIIDGATISIESGYVPNHDRLLVDYQGAYDINATFYKEIGVLKMEGKAPISEYASAISSVVFFTTSEDGNERQITFTFGANTLFFASTRHFYKFVHKPNVAWTTAKSECEAMTYMGMKGYLSTITTAEEMNNLGAKVEERSWIGASRDGDTWYWSSGPESGKSFWRGPSIYRGGAPFPTTAYSNWARFQPDNGSTADAREQLYGNVMPSLGTGVSFFEDSSNLNSVTGYICEFGGLDNKEIEMGYSLYTESVMLSMSCNLYNSSTECINHESLGCSWKGTTCGNSACSTLTTQAQCVANWMCQWNVDDNVGSCVQSPCASLPRDVCSTTPTCTYSRTDGASRCRPSRCFEQSSSCSCAVMPGCEWRESCTNGATVDCSGMDIVYLIDGADVMAEAYGKYTSGFFALTQSLLEADLGLTKTNASSPATGFGQRVGVVQWGPSKQSLVTPNGFGSGGRITGSHSELEADLKWQQSVYSASLTVSNIASGLETAGNMFTDNTRKRIIVIFASREIDDAKSEKVKATVKKLTDAGVKILGVSLRPTSSQSTRTADADDSLSQITKTSMSITMEEVLPRVVYGLCSVADGTAGKLVETNENIQLDCNDHTEFETCDSDPHCSWNYADKTCGNAMCLLLCGKTACDANPACQWSDTKGRCLERCPAIKDKSTCESDPQKSCIWRADAKTPYCDSRDCIANVEEAVCIAEGGCSFLPMAPNSDTFLCKAAPCQFTDSTACTNAEECHWDNGVCQIDTCKGVSKNLCGSDSQPQCMWDEAARACIFNECGKNNGETSCNEDLRCQWNTQIAPARCTIRPCQDKASTMSRENCEKNPLCAWANTGAAVTCTLRECEMNENSADCAAMSSTCVWRNGQCKTSRFVQCPATDVVFLFEATPFSQLAFGRHPSGFSGALEKLRSWVRKAPLSEDQGFRLAVYGYGANKSALTGKGDHGGFFVNVSTFSGAGGHLSRMNEGLPEYLRNVGENDAAITPALTVAKDLFSTQSPANRKKILVIVGAQPITDGATSPSLDSDIVALENSGVSIFTIVLRRFTELSKVEKEAAAFLGPIATDPITSHFRYSSIDDLETDVLNTFCDPSTIFGKALTVSRDGTLPCSWLESKEECNIQPSCFYNSTAKAVCPLDDQCPNMGCRTLPPSIARYFKCEDCQLVSGTFECSKGNPNPIPTGQCQVHPCMVKTQDECGKGDDSQCKWNGASSRCERIMCAATDAQTCNADIGCIYADETLAADTGVPAGCSINMCGKNRDKNSCNSVTIGDRSQACFYNESLSPAVCVQLRCNSLNEENCKAASNLCFWDPTQKLKCQDLRCTHPTNELCELDSDCYWNPFVSKCKVRTLSCEISDEYSAWSPWSTNCGANAVRVRSRTILHFASPGGDSCDVVAKAQEKPITEIETKTWDGDARNCDTYCEKYARSVTDCINDISCEWKQSKCVGSVVKACSSLGENNCNSSDVCAWDATMNLCVDGLKVCTQEDEQSCAAQGDCTWRSGANANMYAKSHSTYALLVKPNQKPVMVFPTLGSIESEELIDGATVTIETNYQRGKDKLAVAFPGKYIKWEFMPSSGTLILSSNTDKKVSVSQYISVIRSVTFQTSSTRGGNARTITWALGNSTVYSSDTKHFYWFSDERGLKWDDARAACERKTRYGVTGYLVTILDDAENSLVSQKLRGVGWISGDNNINGVWQYSSGPEMRRSFWTGNSPVNGGYAALGQYANWNTLDNQPSVTEGSYYHPYLNQSGYWSAQPDTMTDSHGYVCEFGGMPNDRVSVSYPTGGAVVVGVAGCLPSSACGFHETENHCNADVSCTWSANQKRCLSGCGSRSTVAECDHTSSSSSACSWDTNIIPPVCDVNPCSGKATTECTSNPKCKWDKDGCMIKTGCAVYSSKAECDAYNSCQWSGPNSEGKSECLPRTCSSLTHKDDCSKNPTCEWTEDEVCVTILCKYGLQSACQEDSRCSWNEDNGASVAFTAAGGRVLVFENSSVPVDFTSSITGFSVAIIEGFQSGADVLVLDPPDTTQTYLASYNPVKGVLFVRIAPGASSNPNDAFNFMKRRLKFYTSSGSKTRRIISYNMNGTTIYSEFSKSYFTMVKANAKTYEEAENICKSATLVSVTGGRLAKILSQTDNLRLATLGAYGWIGAKSDSNNKWSWSDGTSFWDGAGALGTPDPAAAYAQWAVGEPKASGKYAIMTQGGQWKAVDKMELGAPVICEVTPNTSFIHGKKSVDAVGCFVKPCVGLSRVQCMTQPECVFSDDVCRIDNFCSAGKSISSCNSRERCYWDYTMGACRSTPAVICSVSNFEVTCADSPQCQWYPELLRRDSGGADKGACSLRGCAIHPTRDSCLADAKCRWDQPAGRGDGDCVERLCGYQTTKQCWADPLCEYDYNQARCIKSSCVGKSSSDCTGECYMREEVCAKRKCSSTLKGVCHQDPECLFLGGSCSDPGCSALTTDEQKCTSNSNCFFTYHPTRCSAAQCIAHEDKESCEVIKGGIAQCRWEGDHCRELTWLERNAAAISASCEKEVTPNLWWLWLLLAIIVIILGVIIWRLYLAYAKGLNFFEPTRRNVKYSPHQQYAADLFEDATQRTGETNDVGRPSLTDL